MSLEEQLKGFYPAKLYDKAVCPMCNGTIVLGYVDIDETIGWLHLKPCDRRLNELSNHI